MRRLAAFVLLTCLATPGLAQIAIPDAIRLSPSPAEDGIEAIHVTDMLRRLPESRSALAEYQRRKDLGIQSAAHKRVETVGMVQTFSVYNFVINGFQTLSFTLEAESQRFNVWVESAELSNGRVRDEDVESLRSSLADQTPTGSVNPNQGIIANNEQVFGNPPDVDSDAKTDILVLDIRDSFDPGAGQLGAVLGFFDPRDLTSNNNRDIIYLDSYPGLVSSTGARRDPDEILQTAAHEYQHLIRVAYDHFEYTFVDEGMSEWAEVMNGYTARGIGYVADLDELRTVFLDWRPPNGGPSNRDYQRAGLFTTYLAEQIGAMNAGAITRSTLTGVDGYGAVLQGSGIDVMDLIAGFHVANSLNDASLTNGAGSLRYGYTTPQYRVVGAAARETYEGASVQQVSVAAPPSMAAGSVDYYRFNNLADFTITLDVTASGNPSADRILLRPHLVSETATGIRYVQAFSPGAGPVQVSGNLNFVTLVVPHVDLKSTRRPSYGFDASWALSNTGFTSVPTTYDDGEIANSEAYALSESANFSVDSKAASRFEVPEGGILHRVDASPFFSHEIQGVATTSDARDYTLFVWGDNDGEPGDLLFTLDRTDSRSSSLAVYPQYTFDSVPLSDYAGQLTGLASPIYIGVGNSGTDDNYVYMPVSSYSGFDSPSFFELKLDAVMSWGAFSELSTSSGDKPLASRVLPIRAVFVVPVGTDAESEATLPDRVTLTQNYPNPFNPRTTVSFAVPEPTDVRLSVFDLLGREVAVLVDGRMPAGSHEAGFDGSALSSGLYLYALQANGTRLTRTMLLIK